MENPNFDISYWYAEKRAHELGLTDEINHHQCMDEVISIVATKLLTDGITSSYPSIDYELGPEQRFQVLQTSKKNPENCLIKDFYLGKDVDIPKLWLEDPDFDLVGWYRHHVDKHGWFKQEYCKAHLDLSPIGITDGAEQLMGPEDLTTSPQMSPEKDWDDLPELDVLSSSEFNLDEILDNNNADCVDMPDLDPLSDDSESDEEEEDPLARPQAYCLEDDRIFIKKIQRVLTQCQPFPGDGRPVDPSFQSENPRFLIERQDRGFFCIYDRVQGFETSIHIARLRWDSFSIGEWFAERCAVNSGFEKAGARTRSWLTDKTWEKTIMGADLGSTHQTTHSDVKDFEPKEKSVELGGIQVDKNKYHASNEMLPKLRGTSESF